MEDLTADKKVTAPYLSYATFKNFLDRFKEQGLPERIDKSLMSTFSGSVQNQLMSSLKTFNLVDMDDMPTSSMQKMVNLEGDEFKKFWQELFIKSYPFIFNNGMDLKRATQKSMFECFTGLGMGSDTARKAMTFFISAAESANIELSPFIKKSNKGPRVISRKTRKAIPVDKQSPPPETIIESPPKTYIDPWLSKFPDFDPSWPDDLKSKWFEGFKNLMDLKATAKESQNE